MQTGLRIVVGDISVPVAARRGGEPGVSLTSLAEYLFLHKFRFLDVKYTGLKNPLNNS